MAGQRPVGVITRGTTNPNRLRRCDRWLAGPQGWRLRRAGPEPVVVDLGYGASPVTALELHERLRRVRPDVQVVGIEIDPARVAAARPLERPGLRFVRGGFEVPLPAGARPVLVRAFNVLRQYDEDEVGQAWATTVERLAPGGLLVDGTCDELGRLAAWVAVGADGPETLTLSWRLRGLERPGVVAERLPKALIHRNVPGEPVHTLLGALDDAWLRQAPLASYGVRQRFIATATALREAGWPLVDGPSRWRLGELTLAWSAVAPHQGP
ncbi:class I SAM-dependent methyltransferase [Phycicoccus sp. MAQZ13P-2]|uniref:class I SAM-dependent methyltransferase n=1 Tax=Phycicoccus mangrovi TaxID=2840470 RepID=UPI001C00161B|nr:class I SAM-dependent methyltransferase [Phycicoccus mangrovi]MBT9254893.1 class I SAM-dependent methyltransferase [Phycicoccus mangrovi]MBT9256108.1 class I SAM-dependent methyltransferase [Phycicoccus mangrovi]MBT9273877.1 class I SAM-dependent methyltransferase [Phycicoccus mangrovi]